MSETVHHRKYTWQEWLDACQEANRRGVRSSRRTDRHFTGVKNFDEAFKMASETGYYESPPIVDDLVSKLDTIIEQTHETSFNSVFDVAGAEVDMGRFLSGEPECMRESMPIKVMRTGRIVQLGVPICLAGSIGQRSILRRGAVVMALVDIFARRQHGIEIWAVLAVHGTKRGQGTEPRMSYSIKVQDADQPLDRGRVMYALAHPSMLRVLGFAVEETESDEIVRKFDLNISHGHHGKTGYGIIPDDDFDETFDENLIVLDQLHVNNAHLWDDDKYAIRWIEDQMKKIEEGSV